MAFVHLPLINFGIFFELFIIKESVTNLKRNIISTKFEATSNYDVASNFVEIIFLFSPLAIQASQLTFLFRIITFVFLPFVLFFRKRSDLSVWPGKWGI